MRLWIALVKTMALSSPALRDLIAENSRFFSASLLLAGTACWVLIHVPYFGVASLLIQIAARLLFVAGIYVPAAVVLCNLWAGDGLALQISRREYDSNFVSLAGLVGVLLLASALLGWLAPLPATLALAAGYLIYVPFALKEANSLPWPAAAAAAVVLVATLPLLWLGVALLFALPFFILIWLLFLGWPWLRAMFREQQLRARFEEQLRDSLVNPHNADAFYQLGWLCLNRHQFRKAEEFFQKAAGLQPSDADYNSGLARARMEQGLWMPAFEALEKVYQADPGYQTGDILRDLGQVYFRLDYLDQAEQFLRAFLQERSSDAEGKYWLASVLARKGETAEAREWLRRLADPAATPGVFRKVETRYWKRLGREMAAKVPSKN